MIDVSALQTWCEGQHAWSRELIETLVRLESPSHDKAAVDRCGAELLRRLETCGARCARIPTLDRGDHVRAEIAGEGSQTLILGHFDTVWDVGQIERMPLREEDGLLYGPGIFDMKGGLATTLLALRALQAVPAHRRGVAAGRGSAPVEPLSKDGACPPSARGAPSTSCPRVRHHASSSSRYAKADPRFWC